MRQKNQGFTLIELLVVIIIIGILAALLYGTIVVDAGKRVRDAQRKSDLKQMQAALQLYYEDNQMYPSQTSCRSDNACWQTLLGDSAHTLAYIKKVPQDPTNASGNFYYYCGIGTNPTQYVIVTHLENSQDSQVQTTPNIDCPTSGPNWYWVTNP